MVRGNPAMMQFARALSTSGCAAMAAVPAVAAKSSGLATLLGFGSSRINVPLSEPLPNVPSPLRGSLPAAAPKLETSVIAGITIATLDSISPVSTVAVVLPGGSSFETESTVGASKVLEQVAFKATANRTTFSITREMEKLGAVAYARAGRDSISFAVDACRNNSSEALEVLLDSVLNPKFHYWEVRDAVEAVKEELAQALAQPGNRLSEVVHRAAFEGSLGQPLLVDPSSLDGFTSDHLKEYAARLIDPSRLLIAGVGFNHADIKAVAQPMLEAVHASGQPASMKGSTYLGGSVSVIADSPLSHIALAFEATGGLSDAKNAASAAVVQVLLDSRPTLPWMHRETDAVVSSSSFSHLYKETGLVGITAAAGPKQAGAMIDVVCKRVEAVAKGVAEPQLKLAKQVALGAYKSAMATSAGAVSTMASQLLVSGKYSSADFVSKVESLTSSDVAAFVQKAIKSAPTFVTYGPLSHLPRVDISKRFN